ncbi:hypothetical protein F3Y22_tig00110186pilonHSYRG00065 [Hibiscus syriacus]|uniref:Uncharacterized protein n=1 Tax=Hibiscus syriacus TaxID=106335 RepID=A0A6A3BGZ8_HIBSY|nr:hypothetical protein F3Y22_tig00110186pilonHSYRG00065 [Hibiscus syriacus]
MAGVAAATDGGGAGVSLLGLKLASIINYVLIGHWDVGVDGQDLTLTEVLALDEAYPLPLLGVMLEKFLENLKPAVWWPRKRRSKALERRTLAMGSHDGAWTTILAGVAGALASTVKR